MKFIEMFGLPGVGKSTLTSQLAELALNDHGKLWKFEKAVLLSQQLGYECEDLPTPNIRVLTSHWSWLLYVLVSYLRTTCSAYRAIKRIKWSFDVLMTYSRCKQDQNDNQIVLRDEGFCCRAFSLVLSNGGRTDGIDEFLRLMPAPDGVVILHADLSTIKTRIAVRETTSGRPETNKIDDYQPYLYLLDLADKVLRERNIPVLKVCAEVSVDQQINAVKSFLLEISLNQQTIGT